MVPATPELEQRLDGVLERAGMLHGGSRVKLAKLERSDGQSGRRSMDDGAVDLTRSARRRRVRSAITWLRTDALRTLSEFAPGRVARHRA